MTVWYLAHGKIVFRQQRDAAGMVDVRVWKYYIGDGPGVKGEGSVFFVGLFPASLEQSAVHQYAVVSGFQKVHRTGNFPYGPVKCYLHWILSFLGKRLNGWWSTGTYGNGTWVSRLKAQLRRPVSYVNHLKLRHILTSLRFPDLFQRNGGGFNLGLVH